MRARGILKHFINFRMLESCPFYIFYFSYWLYWIDSCSFPLKRYMLTANIITRRARRIVISMW